MKSLYIYTTLIFLLLHSSLTARNLVSYEKHDGSSIEKCFGASLPSQLKFKNTSKQDFFDFAFSLRYKDGSPLDFSIDSVHVKIRDKKKDFSHMSGTGGVHRIGAIDANGDYDDDEAVDYGDIFTLDFFLSSTPNKPWCINIQPTDDDSRAIAASEVAAFYGNDRTYVLALDMPMATSGLFPGVSFADVNMSGYPIDSFFLSSIGAPVQNPIFLSPQGDTLPPRLFDPTTGLLLPPAPVLPGEPFRIAFPVMSFPITGPLSIRLQAILPGPLREPHVEIPFVQNLMDQGQPTNAGIVPYRYLMPPYYPEPFLQIFVLPPSPSQPPLWIGQNIMLEHFPDTMRVDLFSDLDFLPPGATGVQLAWMITDTITEQLPPVNPFLFSNYPIIPTNSDFGRIPIGPHSIPPLPNPLPLPPIRQWENGTSEGVLIGCKMPNFDLDSSRYRGDGRPKPYVPNDYAGDWNACGPVATTNSFSWLRSLHPDVDQKLGAAFGEGDTAMRKMLADFSKLMDRAGEDPVYITDFVEAKLAFVDKYKLPIRVSWQSMHRNDNSIASPNAEYGHEAKRDIPQAQPGQTMAGVTPEFLLQALQDSCDTEILVNWRKVDSAGNVTYPNGHYVTLTGIRNANGNWRIKWKDDAVQGAPGGTRQGISDMVVDSATGMVRIPGMDNDRWGTAFISNVAIECYDPTVTFKQAKGNAFRDPSGSGTSTGKKGAGGMTVNLIDQLTGNVVGTTVTAPDGSYRFEDIGDPSVPKLIQFVIPQGVTVSPQGRGTDSTNSDINPVTGFSQALSFNNDTVYTIDAGFRIPGLDLKIFPEALYNPLADSLFGFLTLPGICDACYDLNLPISAGWQDTLIMPPVEFTQDFQNFVIPPDSFYLLPPVEWAYVSLWDSINAAQPILSVSCIVLSDGTIVTPQYQPLDLWLLPLPPTVNQAHVSIWVPGHLGIITGNPLPLFPPTGPVPLPLDFTNPGLPIPMPPQMNGLELMGQALVMSMGDTNADGVVDAGDRVNTWNSQNAVGYVKDDVNRDGAVDAADRAATWNKRNKRGHALK